MSIEWSSLTPEQKDALVAEKVMEWRPTLCEATEKDIFYAAESAEKVRIYCSKCGYQDREGIIYRGIVYWVHSVPQPHYTQSMDAAWLVVRMMNNSDSPTFHSYQGYADFIDALEKIVGSNMFFDLFYCDKDGDHLTPERICKAALQAVGVEI